MRAQAARESDVRLSITPLIDVTFLLLIFFMCAMKFKTLERKVAAFLPKDKGQAQTKIKIDEPEKIRVVLKRRLGETTTRVKLLDTEIGAGEAGFDVLDRRIHQIHANPASAELDGFIDAWEQVPHADVVRVVDSFLKAGISNVEFKGTAPKGRAR